MSPRQIADGFELGARNAVGVALACASAGIIIGAITLTGLGLKLGNGLVELAGGNLLLTLVFTMITSLILGMGVPTTANYIITSTIAAPALIQLGVHPLAAHMFVFYFGIVADITPPVALAAYAGAGIAKSNAFWTGVTSTKLAIGAFLTPYIFVYNTSMLWIDTTWYAIHSDADHVLRGHDGDRGGHDRLFRGTDELDRADLVYSRRADDGPSGDGDGPHRHRLAGRVRGLPVPQEKSRGRQHGHHCGRVNENS